MECVQPADAPDVLERIQANLEIVDAIARQVAKCLNAGLDRDELVAFGREGLLFAARRFDPSRGVPFQAYARQRVRGAMYDGIRSMSALSRRAHERLAGLEAAALYEESEAEYTFAPKSRETDPGEAEQAIAEHLAGLATAVSVGLLAETVRPLSTSAQPTAPTAVARDRNPEEALARAELLGIVREALKDLSECESAIVHRHYFLGELLEDVGEDLGMSKSWASRIHSRAMARLTKRLRGSI